MDFPLKGNSQRLIADVLNIISEAVLVIDADDRIVFASRKAWRMFAAAAGEGLHEALVAEIFLPEDREVLVPNILRLTRETGEFEGEAMFQRRDGSRFLGRLASAFLSRGRERVILLVVHDISHMKELERDLRQSERVAFVGHMLDDISHQIRNPVMAIGGFARRLARVDDERKGYAEAIVNESEQLERLLDRLGFFVRIPRPRLQPVRLGEVLDLLSGLLGSLAGKKGLPWEVDCPADLLQEELALDPGLFRQAVEELVRNACEASEATGEGGAVTIRFGRSTRDHYAYEMAVSDCGVGIDPDDLSRVSDHFFTKKERHVGLGLSIAGRIIEDQQGEINFSSEPRLGTCVTVFLIRERRRPIRTRILRGAGPDPDRGGDAKAVNGPGKETGGSASG